MGGGERARNAVVCGDRARALVGGLLLGDVPKLCVGGGKLGTVRLGEVVGDSSMGAVKSRLGGSGDA